MKRLPAFLKRYFWDTDFAQLEQGKDAIAVIARILDLGNRKAVKWMKTHYTLETIANVLYTYRMVSPRSANFWAIVLNLPREKILCLQKPYQTIQRRHWQY